jgi:DNA-binding transcriptional ArsR family regulator
MEAVFDFINDQGEATVMDIYMSLSGPSLSSVERHLRALVRTGRVEFTVDDEGERVYRTKETVDAETG